MRATTSDAGPTAPPPTEIQRAPVVDGSTLGPGPDEPPVPPKTSTPASAPAMPDAGMVMTTPITRCGDAIVSGTEKCDISIPEGMPGACPTSCPKLDTCAPRGLNGTACQAECVLLELVCQKGDGCCPGKCTQDNDPDCSPSCGDGIVQMSRGETCEPKAEPLCLTDAAACDDHDPCTQDALTGSAANCNAACTNTKITTPKAADSCCPEGANATVDSDCVPRCGNQVREADELCDGGNGCDASCKPLGNPDQVRCLEAATTDCEKCACMNCTATELACRMGADAIKTQNCKAIIECAKQNDCVGVPCYCGPGICGLPFGPCKEQIELAAGTTDVTLILPQRDDPTTAVGMAYAADGCRVTQCRATCR